MNRDTGFTECQWALELWGETSLLRGYSSRSTATWICDSTAAATCGVRLPTDMTGYDNQQGDTRGDAPREKKDDDGEVKQREDA